MPEIHQSLASLQDWKNLAQRLGNRDEMIETIIQDVRDRGYVEPFTGIYRPSSDVTIGSKNIRESISSHQLNSRKRALLLQTYIELHRNGWLNNPKLRLLAAEGITRAACILRGHYPYFLGAEYLPDEAARAQYFPIPHLDLQNISYADASFDVFFSGDVFEHVPDLDRALEEIGRILKPGGVLISSFPFSPGRAETLVKAQLSKDGEIKYLTEPEYHGNPVDPEGGSLVFSIPGWDILDKLKAIGFEEAEFKFLASSRYGVTVQHTVGALTLVARKAGSDAGERDPKTTYFYPAPLPRKLVCALGLPRSGTTLLTSLFA
ncbi:MAG: class I SAM-dependent methyltransferase, partial [Henriciella sp.]|uniref:class I SAM-dependent methyltransferase n=1 Tax=Henriciella sp. TaxID=1968823 RepID=UPI003C73366D